MSYSKLGWALLACVAMGGAAIAANAPKGSTSQAKHIDQKLDQNKTHHGAHRIAPAIQPMHSVETPDYGLHQIVLAIQPMHSVESPNYAAHQIVQAIQPMHSVEMPDRDGSTNGAHQIVRVTRSKHSVEAPVRNKHHGAHQIGPAGRSKQSVHMLDQNGGSVAPRQVTRGGQQ